MKTLFFLLSDAWLSPYNANQLYVLGTLFYG